MNLDLAAELINEIIIFNEKNYLSSLDDNLILRLLN
jgi:hypothetical protein